MATTDPLTGYEPELLGILDDFEVLPTIFQGWDINQICSLGIDREESGNAEMDHEHFREAVASPFVHTGERSRSHWHKLITRMRKVC